jgi:hypothetical protein
MALSTAIRYLQRGEWEKAHSIVRNDSTDIGCWAHGIVHLIGGDLGNARYWFRRAGRPFPRERDASVEIDALVSALRQQAVKPSNPARQQGAKRQHAVEQQAAGRSNGSKQSRDG